MNYFLFGQQQVTQTITTKLSYYFSGYVVYYISISLV